ncbi:MAG: hypothetical protein IT229_07340 [Flavobacteriales bacterium]|nr:hypothetical protein [Flavobacteriales bacterium]
MNNPWLKILVFSLLFGAVGFLLGRNCCGGGRDRGHCEAGMSCKKGGAECHGKSMCEHGGACCSGEGKCEMADCDHKMGGACCKGMGHGMGEGMGHGKGACCHPGKGGADRADAIVEKLTAANFQGDTTVAIDGGTVQVSRHGDKLEVKVEMTDSVKVVEKVVEVR